MENITQGQWFRGPSADLGAPIDQSLRFQSANSTNLETTLGTPTDRDRWSWSCWVKRGGISESTRTVLFAAGPTSGLNDNNRLDLGFETGDGVFFTAQTQTAETTAKYRDPSAWMHIVYTWDGTTLKGYVNGVRQMASTVLSGDVGINGAESHRIGRSAAAAEWFFHGYMAEMNFLDGTLVGETTVDGEILIDEFGRYNEDGVWVPKAISFTSDQYGNNGFRLKFDSSADGGIGDDSAPTGGNHDGSNDFTANNFDTAAISSSNEDNDVDYFDTPTNNYATLNPLNVFDASVTYSKANLRANYGDTGNRVVFVDMPMAAGKYYWELTLKDDVEGWAGVITEDYVKRQLTNFADNSDSWAYELSGSTNNQKRHIGSNTDSHGSLVSNDTIGFLLDIASGTLKIEINGTTQSNSEFTNIPTNERLFVAFNIGGGAGNTVSMDWNFGQMPFVHSQTGYSDVATNSLPVPTIKNGRDHFNILTWTGTGSSNARTGLGFQPDLVWVKKRADTTESHDLQDSIRGAGERFRTNSTDGSTSVSGTITSFDSDGFTVVDSGTTNESGKTYVAWCWKAGSAPTTTNSANAGDAQTAGSVKVDDKNGSFAQGTIKVNNLSVNTTAGFSIATYTGTGSAGTIPHGLGAAPEWALLKRTDGTSAWSVYHKSMGNQNKMALNENLKMSDFGTGTDIWNGTSPTNQVFSIGVAGDVNTLNEQFIAYMWAPVKGFSKFGSYEGNGNTDGTFVYLGFKPSLIIFKNVDALGSWVMYDTARNTDNPVDTRLTANTKNTKGTSSSMHVDFLSNGFKHRNNDQDLNSNDTFVYMAFAENPFGGTNQPPATAR